MQDLARVDDKATPAEVIHGVARRTAKTLGVHDPYLEEKKRWVSDTTGNADWIRSVVDGAPDPFLAALHLSIAANILDCELRQEQVPKSFSLKTLVEGYSSLPFARDNVEEFREAIAGAGKILYVLDSAGEAFFDRLLIEKFGKPQSAVVAVVRQSPILADATREDAVAVGISKVADVISPGIDCLGIHLSSASQELRDHFETADIVVAKGQACYETLENTDFPSGEGEKPMFFLLRVKCHLLARHLGAAVGDCVLEVG
jgi:hypothetical protein